MNANRLPASWKRVRDSGAMVNPVVSDFGSYRHSKISVLVVPCDERSLDRACSTSGKTRSQLVSISTNAAPKCVSAFPANGEVCRSFKLLNHTPQNSQSEEA